MAAASKVTVLGQAVKWQGDVCPWIGDAVVEVIEFGRWRLLCDPAATRQAVTRIPQRAPASCGCSDCQNFLAVHNVYPAAVLDLLGRLGIESIREAEVYHLARLES